MMQFTDEELTIIEDALRGYEAECAEADLTEVENQQYLNEVYKLIGKIQSHLQNL